MDNNELMHWGIKGMKWGHRKASSTSSSGSTGLKKSKKSDDYVRAKALKKKRISQMSNAELKELNNRMQLEQTYKSLKKQRVSAGKKFIRDVAYETAKNTTSEYAKKYAKKGIEYLVNKK